MLSVAAAPSPSYYKWVPYPQDQGLSIPSALVACITTSSTHKLSQKTWDAGHPGASTFPQQLPVCLALPNISWEVFFAVHRASHCSRQQKR